VAVRLCARWARLFRWVTLRHCVGVEFGAPRLCGDTDGKVAHLREGVTLFLGSVRWRTAAYKYVVAPPPFLFHLLVFIPSLPLLSCCLSSLAVSRAHASSSSSGTAVPPAEMPVRLVAADDWRPSSMTERRLLKLEKD